MPQPVSAFDELSVQCERRGWRVALTGSAPAGSHQAGLRLATLEVRGRRLGGQPRELLVRIPVKGADAASLNGAALDAAAALVKQGLVT